MKDRTRRIYDLPHRIVKTEVRVKRVGPLEYATCLCSMCDKPYTSYIKVLKYRQTTVCHSCRTKQCVAKAHEEGRTYVRQSKYPDLAGKVFGKLTVIEPAKKKVRGQVLWKCQCSCGNSFEAYRGALNQGRAVNCKECGQKRRVEKTTKWPGVTSKERNKNARLKKLFNITLEDYNRILSFQGNVCAITKVPARIYVVDHDHKTGKIRGLLDWRINKALGSFMDNPEWLQSAAEYLRSNPAELALGEPVYGVLGRITKKAKNRRYGPDGSKTPHERTINIAERSATPKTDAVNNTPIT